MKSRTFICLMFFLVMSLPIYSQNMKVTVVDKDGNALSYASIYINKGQCCITNIDGVALIPKAKLNYGDTIMATYIGLSPGMIIYSEKMQNASETLTLNSEKNFEISPVVITSDFKGVSLDLFYEYPLRSHSIILLTNAFQVQNLPQLYVGKYRTN